jgi:hypothetical protein
MTNKKCPICNGEGFHTVYEGTKGEPSIQTSCGCGREKETTLSIQQKIRILKNNFAKEKGQYPTILWINPTDFLGLMKSYEPYLSPERTLRNYFDGMDIIIVNVSGLSFLAVGDKIMTPMGWYPKSKD